MLHNTHLHPKWELCIDPGVFRGGGRVRARAGEACPRDICPYPVLDCIAKAADEVMHVGRDAVSARE